MTNNSLILAGTLETSTKLNTLYCAVAGSASQFSSFSGCVYNLLPLKTSLVP